MNLKKYLALALCLILTLSLAACGNTPAASGSGNPGDSESPGGSENPGESPEPSPLPAYVNEFTQALAGIDGDTVMFTVDGIDATAEFFFYWLSYDCYMADMYFQMYLGQYMDLGQETGGGNTLASDLKEDARELATFYLMLEKEAEARGAGPTEEQKAQIAEQKASRIEAEGQESYDQFLRQQGLSEEMFDRLSLMRSCLLENMLATIPAPTEEEAEAYRTENNIYGAKHILIRTVVQNGDGSVSYYRGGTPTGEDGSPYSGTAEEFNAAALEKVNDILAQINEADDHEAAFDELMKLHSEDPGLAAYPDGYTFGPGEMHAEFEAGTTSLGYGEYSAEPVETADGYHIILRTCPDVTDTYRSEQLGLLQQGWSELEFTATPAYDALDVKDFYEKYTAHMESFMDTQEASPAES